MRSTYSHSFVIDGADIEIIPLGIYLIGTVDQKDLFSFMFNMSGSCKNLFLFQVRHISSRELVSLGVVVFFYLANVYKSFLRTFFLPVRFFCIINIIL